ncbi:SHOCT domain-containing protein [Salinibacillus xinjiangensis]|uniref:SHOCT domain-containing protein n=1 Tax=Salinibacillus xinjiangensis TaxID=1229268 RepID=A0A6G1X2E5_9BACI|nr:hypothetical protein [Salinibacillus xinjiangensis]MRG85099.1 hypothetical protein [Salinibacillus xinjiangensis]
MHQFGYFFPFGIFFTFLLFGLIITNIILWKRRKGLCYQDNHLALTTLNNRLAKGEITVDEYNDLKEILKK